MIAWVVQFTKEGKKTLHELHINNQRNIKDALKELAKTEKQGKDVKELTETLQGFYSLHVSNYRVIYSMIAEKLILHYTGHRKTIYDEFSELT